MKKFFAVLILLLMTSASCLAMTFQNPVEIGSISAGGGDKLKIDGATEIHATPASRPNTYIKGIATFGEIYHPRRKTPSFSYGDIRRKISCNNLD